MLRISLISLAIILIIIVIRFLMPGSTRPDEYLSFAELKKYEKEHTDYRIRIYERNPEVAIFAIHGGNIEVGTSELAEDLGERLEASTYIFEGLKPKGNSILHITSTLYDEPAGVRMAEEAVTSLSLHGYRDVENERVYVGGRNKQYKEYVIDALEDAGFDAEDAPDRLGGTGKDNIVNRGKKGGGVQLELSTKLRESFFKDRDFAMNNRKQPTEAYKDFIKALEKATEKYKEEELT
ncbi:poly-gamma-glutamate hydrolase family protein [Bacillus infantis]|uniref:poly-gamma-glutamate hydrolase family protein n=1 Tax=Bacillus infantis TaxID=324767 RepID=UPI003CF6DAAF